MCARYAVMVSTHDRCFERMALESAVPSIITMSESAAFIDLEDASDGMTLVAAAAAVKLRNARRFGSLGLFNRVRSCGVTPPYTAAGHFISASTIQRLGITLRS